MNKKTGIIAIVVIIILVVGGVLIFHKPKKTTPVTSLTSAAAKASTQATTVNNSVLKTETSTAVGNYLADPTGKTLYTYSGDTKGVSNCVGSCLTTWPAYLGTSNVGLPTNVVAIMRTDSGKLQYTYKGQPLYYYIGDSSAGQVNGNGVGGFSVAKP